MDSLAAFNEHVAMKYQLYNGLFLTLPFEGLSDAGIMLPIFNSYAREHLQRGRSPIEIVDRFFEEKLSGLDARQRTATLFKFMQMVERQVVLFDAIEDASYDRVRDVDGPGSLRDLLGRLESLDRRSDLTDMLEEYRVRLVLTAHPTQFYPDEILGIITDLGAAVTGGDLKQINDLLLQMGKTRFKNKAKPTPLDEAKSLLWFMENIFYRVLPDIHRRLLEATDLGASERVNHPSPVELGFWPGGDRDGNPFVTSELTVRIGHILRESVLSLYERDMQRLIRRLTFDGVVERIEEIAERLHYTREPYTVVPGSSDDDGSPGGCRDMSERGYDSVERFRDDLIDLREQVGRDHGGLFVHLVDDLIYKTQLFGFHFATMDIRQDSRVHGRLVEEIVALLARYGAEKGHTVRVGAGDAGNVPDYTTLSVEKRLALIEEISDLFPLDRDILDDLPEEGIAGETIRSLRAARYMQELNGERGVHRYIISNTRSSANVLEVWLLAQCAGWPSGDIALDLVPLFETIDDLERATEIMDELFTVPLYRNHLERRGGVQTIMLGFSDGTKDGGYMTANWNIYRAKQRLTEVTRRHGFRVVFFDGRGGPPARGGGNTHKFYRSLGRNIESREIHLTIQGQTISSKYGVESAANHNVEQMVSAGLECSLFPENNYELSADDIELLEELSSASIEAYRELKNHPRFVEYLLDCSPLRYYGMTNIGSRPTSRSPSSDFRLEDLRAIPFVGSWSQLKQNVPGYFGLGSGIEAIRRRGRGDDLGRLYRKSLFFRTLIENAMQSLRKTYFPLTYHFQRDERFRDIWKRIFDEAQRTIREVKEVSGQHDLLETEPVIRKSIELREQMVLPSLVIQHYALGRLREAGAGERTLDDNETVLYEKMIVKSLAAGVNASRNAV